MKPLTLMDEEEVYELFNNDLVLQSYPVKPIDTREQTPAFIRRITTDGCWSWKITPLEGSDLIGICSVHHLDEVNKTIEIGGTLLPQYWGKGVMGSAFEIIIERAQMDFKVEKVIGRTLSSNIQAIQLVKKLGFELVSTGGKETVLTKRLV